MAPRGGSGKPDKLSLKRLMEGLGSGRRYGVFIDDTGSPGAQVTEAGPHPERASWVGVVIGPSEMPEILEQMPGAVRGLKLWVGASEFHCKDIFQGREEFKGVPLKLRLAILEFLAHIFSSYRFPIFVQTLDPLTLASVHQREPGFKEARWGPFDLSSAKDAALFLLLVRIREYLAEKRQSPDCLAGLFADEGFVKSGMALELPGWKDVFVDGLLCFVNSATVLPLQLADFAAYALNRYQILLGRSKLSPLDRTLLAIFAKASLNFQNIATVRLNIDQQGGWDWGPVH